MGVDVGGQRRLCVRVCVWEGLISSLRHNIICAIFVTGPWVYLHIVLLLLCCCLFFHSAFVAADAKGGGGDVSDLLYRRRCCVYINRSFCSQQEQKDDTISWVLCESCMDFPLSSFFFSASVFFFFFFFFFFFCAFWWQIALFASVQMEMNQQTMRKMRWRPMGSEQAHQICINLFKSAVGVAACVVRRKWCLLSSKRDKKKRR